MVDVIREQVRQQGVCRGLEIDDSGRVMLEEVDELRGPVVKQLYPRIDIDGGDPVLKFGLADDDGD